MNMIIRKATLHDLETLLFLGKELYYVEKEFELGLKYSEDEARTRYSQQFQNPLALFLIAQNDREDPIGYLYAHVENADNLNNLECNLEVIYIKPEFRGQGISNKFIRSCLDWAKQNNIKRIETEIFAKNIVSRKVFERQGFEPYLLNYSLDI